MRVMLVYGMGGHLTQTKLLEQGLQDYELIRVIPKDDEASRLRVPGEKYFVTAPRTLNSGLPAVFWRTMKSVYESFRLVAKVRPTAIISFGPGLAVPVMLAGKIFGAKIIFVESWSRVNTRSTTGRFVHLFADMFFVQWEQQAKEYRKARFVGRLR